MKIFIGGPSRSGTTLVSRILNRHPDVFAFHELHFIEGLWDMTSNSPMKRSEALKLAELLFLRQKGGFFAVGMKADAYRDDAENLVAELGQNFTGSDLFEKFLDHETQTEGKVHSCEHTPRNVFYLEEILRLYPDAKCVVLVRDPRAILASQKYKWKRRFLGAKNIPLSEAIRSYFNYNPYLIGRLIQSAYDNSQNFRNHPRVFHVQFETLLTNPENVVRNLSDFLGLEFMSEMLEVDNIGSSIKQDKTTVIGLDNSKMRAWSNKLKAYELSIIEKLTIKIIERENYRAQSKSLNPIMNVILKGVYFGKTLIALLMNLNRAKNLIKTIKKRLK